MITASALSNSANLTLSTAILLYSLDKSSRLPESKPNHLATLHNILTVNGVPEIGPGRPITSDEAEDLAKELCRSIQFRQFLPASVLVHSPSLLVWWSPSTVRRLFIAKNEDKERAFDGFNGKPFHHPPLLFAATEHRLSVFALGKNERPSPSSKLYRAPYPNVADSGAVGLCRCTPPDSCAIDTIKAWEKTFYDSAFSHLASRERITRFPGGIVPLFKHLTSLRKPAKLPATPSHPFPFRYLIPQKLTLSQLISRDRH